MLKNVQVKYISYRRKSSDSEDKQVLSLPSQKVELDKFVIQNQLKVIKDFEESQSAYSVGRPGFNEMIKMIKAGKANSILVYHISRLARNMTDGGIVIDMLKDGLLQEIRTPSESYSKNSGQEFFLALQFAMSKKSSDDTSEFVLRDIQAKLKKGEYPGYAPRGYLNIDKEGKIAGKQYSLKKQIALENQNRKLKRIEKDPIMESMFVKLYELCASGQYSTADLREKSYEWGITGGRSKKILSRATIHRVLTDPFYYGAIPWKGEIIEPEELPEENRHDPLVSRELFNRVQVALGTRSRPVKKKKYYTYTNLISCGVCGGNISAMTGKGNVYYRCCKCRKQQYIREKDLEIQIMDSITNHTVDEDFYNMAIKKVNQQNEEEINKRDSIKANQQSELDRCQVRLDNLLRLKISPENKDGDLLNDEEFISQKRETLQQIAIIKSKMNQTDSENQHWSKLCVDYLDFNKRLLEKFKKVNPGKKREIFDFLYCNPTITAKTLLTQAESPHKFIIQYNTKKEATITAQKQGFTTKKEALTSLFELRRGLVDDFRTMDWVEVRENLRYSTSKNIEKYISFKE